MNWGWIVSAAVLAPNLLWMALPTVDAPHRRSQVRRGYRILLFLEHVGRIALILLPIFYDVHVNQPVEVIALFIALIALVVYYMTWARFFGRGRMYRLLFLPMWRMPVPIAIAPVIVFLSASVLFHSWLYAIVAIFFGVIHVGLTITKR